MDGGVRAFSRKKLALAKAERKPGWGPDLRWIKATRAILLIDKRPFTMEHSPQVQATCDISVRQQPKRNWGVVDTGSLKFHFWSYIHATN
jgi:hypothetical protein